MTRDEAQTAVHRINGRGEVIAGQMGELRDLIEALRRDGHPEEALYWETELVTLENQMASTLRYPGSAK